MDSNSVPGQDPSDVWSGMVADRGGAGWVEQKITHPFANGNATASPSAFHHIILLPARRQTRSFPAFPSGVCSCWFAAGNAQRYIVPRRLCRTLSAPSLCCPASATRDPCSPGARDNDISFHYVKIHCAHDRCERFTTIQRKVGSTPGNAKVPFIHINIYQI